jgi:hypothetical protein
MHAHGNINGQHQAKKKPALIEPQCGQVAVASSILGYLLSFHFHFFQSHLFVTLYYFVPVIPAFHPSVPLGFD